MTTRNLQYQMSNGNWINCNGGYDGKQADRTEKFLTLCETNNGPHENGSGKIVARCSATRPATRDEVLAALDAGQTLRNDASDWYSNCRYLPAQRPVVEVPMKKCSCGHTVPVSMVMSASAGSSCPDCYDRMSE